MKGPQPSVKAVLICDQVIQDISHKYSVIGIFRRVSCAKFPVFHSKIGFYMMLGGMNGIYDFTLSFTEPKEGKEIARAEVRGVKHDKPLIDFETGINLPGLGFDSEGVYEVSIFCNGKLLHIDTISVVQVGPPAAPREPA